jgi:hypothetical protein
MEPSCLTKIASSAFTLSKEVRLTPTILVVSVAKILGLLATFWATMPSSATRADGSE